LLKILHMAGRALGALCGGALSLGWAYALWVPTAGVALAGASVVLVALLMAALALFAAIASWRGHPTVVMLVFLASFFPVGLSLVPSEHWLRWLGYLDVGLLVGGLLIWITARAAKPVEAVE
jgi:hypothetical protein